MSPDDETRRALTVFAGGLVDALVRAGVQHFCVCPGSRSTPLALLIARHPGARLWMHLDERSAAYFSLGLAKSSRAPVGLVCTSGTAAANFFPAIVEASYARVPLVVLTADRPHELRDAGAAQTIDQVGLYGSAVRWFADLPEPDDRPEVVRYARAMAARAVATAQANPGGPVHLNCPFREPLLPAPVEASGDPAPADRPLVVESGARLLPPATVAALAAELAARPRGLIVCGPQDDPSLPPALADLAARLGYPILADPLSGLRHGLHDHRLVLDGYDALLRERHLVERLVPEVVLRFGAIPTSKPLVTYLERHADSPQILVDGGAGWRDPTHHSAQVLHADEALLCSALSAALGPAAGDRGEAPWPTTWRRANDRARAVIQARLAALPELFEGKVFAALAERLPAGALLYVGNSMPVRDLDGFFPATGRPIRVLGNRGVNGIDGVVSSALGAAATSPGPAVLVIGDLSFYHDSNGLLAAARHHLNLTIVLFNNDGGGIFSFLPQVGEPEFEPLFGTPHGLDFRPLAETYGARFTRVTCWEQFHHTLALALEARGLAVIEVPTDRARNARLHQEIWAEVSVALEQEIVAR
jgi:2-succinyl-5-enolpyruvyl-6-hydroxy-3-cyclohexene-1-carboxylate synthase